MSFSYYSSSSFTFALSYRRCISICPVSIKWSMISVSCGSNCVPLPFFSSPMTKSISSFFRYTLFAVIASNASAIPIILAFNGISSPYTLRLSAAPAYLRSGPGFLFFQYHEAVPHVSVRCIFVHQSLILFRS